MKRLVLFVDGPLRGTVVAVERPPVYQPNGLEEPARTYTIHKFRILGRSILVGSVQPVAADVSYDDMFTVVVSSGAQACVILDRPPQIDGTASLAGAGTLTAEAQQ